MRLPSAFASLVLVSTAGAFAACSDDDTGSAFDGAGEDDGGAASSSSGGTDGGGTKPPTFTNLTESRQTGRVVRAQSPEEYVEGATVTVGLKTATTNANGEYEIIVPRNASYQMTIAANGFYKLLEQEWSVNREVLARGDTSLLPTATANLLAGLLPDRNDAKGLLVVKVNAMSPCESEEGSTLSIEPPGEAKVAYFGGSLPDSSQKSVKKGLAFSAAIYNVDIGVDVKVTVSSPTCAQVPFPFQVGDVTYTGLQKTEPGEALSYLRVYLRDPKVADAGSD